MAMRAYRAAGMLVRIDERRERIRTFQRRIEGEAQFSGEAVIGTEAGGDHEFVDLEAIAAIGDDGERPLQRREARDADAGAHRDAPGGDEAAHGGGEGTALGQLVIGAITRLEIWDSQAWQSYLDEHEDSYSQGQEEALPGIF